MTAYIARLLRAIFNRPLDEREVLQGAVDLQEIVAHGECVLAERLTKKLGRPVLVKCVNESWILVADRGASWGLLTQHTLSDIHFSPEVERDVLQGLFASKRIPHHAARYRAPAIGRIS
jgi:hypothetical protein